MDPKSLPLVTTNPVPKLPVLFLWPHSNCNCRCLMCDIWKDRSRKEITTADIERWLGDWRHLEVKHVVLTGGEPLMHTHLWDLCKLLRSSGLVITLLSTGITLYRFADRVVECCTGVRVSLDGPPAVHDKIRRIPGAFDKLRRSVTALKAVSPHFPVFGRSAIHRYNFRNLEAIVAAAQEIGLDRISFLATDVTTEAFNRQGGLPPDRVSDLALGPEDLPELEEALFRLEQRCEKEFDTGYINESPADLHQRLLQYYRALLGKDEFAPNNCNAPWISALIEYDGNVKPCFFQPSYGNLHESASLSSLINSPAAVAFRDRLNVRTDPICRRCVCTFAIHRCACPWSRNPPFCDNSCLVADLLCWEGPDEKRDDS